MIVTKEQKIRSTIRLIKALVPAIDDMFDYMEANGGWLVLNDVFFDLIEKLNLSNWSELYLDEQRFKAISMQSCLDKDALQDISDPAMFREELKDALSVLLEESSIERPMEKTLDEYKAAFESATEVEKNEVTAETAVLILAAVTSFLNYLALMVHGRSMCQLVADAMTGDDDAYRNAVQIDRTVLYLPYFRKRMFKAQFGRDEQFLDSLSYRLKSPILRGRIKYRKLWLTFAILQDEGLLGLPQDQIFDICQEVGAYGRDQGVEDVGHLRKRLQDYRRYQGKSKNI